MGALCVTMIHFRTFVKLMLRMGALRGATVYKKGPMLLAIV